MFIAAFYLWKMNGTAMSGPNKPSKYAVRVRNRKIWIHRSEGFRDSERHRTYRNSDIAPSHRIPIGNVNEVLLLQNPVRWLPRDQCLLSKEQ